MQRMGFRHIGELFALPRNALGRRFGKEFLRYLMRLGGELPDPRPAHRPREHFEAGLHFLEPVGEAGRLLFPMRRLLGDLSQFLMRRQCFCQRLEWLLQPAHGALLRVPLACSLEHHREGALLDLTRLALERLRLPEPVASLALHCRELAPLAGHNADLFDEETHAGIESEHRLLDRLRLRLGPEELHGVLLADAHLPERAWRSTPVGSAAPCVTHRPCWLLREPAPVSRGRHGLDWNGPLELLGGPERIESEWWSGAQARDYFVARSGSGALVWVYRDRVKQRWFVQGVFG